MTIMTQLTKVHFYSGSALALPFPVMHLSHLRLVLTDIATNEETAVTSGYTATGLGTDKVTLNYAVPSGKKLTVYRLLPYTQEMDLENGSAYDGEVVETHLDITEMQIQQLAEEVGRAIKVSVTYEGDPPTAEELEDRFSGLAERAEDAADRAEDAADRAENAAELAELASYVRNIRRSWTAKTAVVSGGILQLPSPYYPGRAMLLLMHEGTVCAPLDRMALGSPQYEEVGDPKLDVPSHEVKVHFPIKAGEELSMWVIASNAYRVEAIVEGYRDEARVEANRATDQADRAENEANRSMDQADRAESEADRARDEADRSKSEADRAEEAAEKAELLSAVENIRRTWRAAKAVAAGGEIELPHPARYFPGRKMVLFMHEGSVCSPAEAGISDLQYEEIGDPALDEPSSRLKVLFPIAAGEELSVWIIASNAWRVSDEVKEAQRRTQQHVDEAEAAVEKAEAAAERAETAVSAAEAHVADARAQVLAAESGVSDAAGYASEAKGHATSAMTQADAANAARNAAEAAATEIKTLSAAAMSLPPESAATASYDGETGVLFIGVPKGDKGDKGEKGNRGDDGTSVTILGSFPAMEALPVAGNPGDAYLVQGDLCVWNLDIGAWDNVGRIQGPKGDTPPLSEAVDSDDAETAASSKAVKTAYDKAVSAQATANAALPATGTAVAASKLANARTIQTNLAGTAVANFDGTANIAPGVTGTLPVENGGTGATTVQDIIKMLYGPGGAKAAPGYLLSFDGSGAASGYTTPLQLRNTMGLGNTTGALPLANGGTGNTAGLAASASKLATARTLRTNLASTTAASFDGTANITPGVTGTLPVANGGTGNTTGLAASATVLATARTIRTNLASTAAASFNGSANVAPGVTGILPLANGGTGTNTAAKAAAALGAVTTIKVAKSGTGSYFSGVTAAKSGTTVTLTFSTSGSSTSNCGN